MQKIFCPNDNLEFKINNKWILGGLKDINIDENKFKIFIAKEKKTIEFQNSSLSINNFNLDAITNSSEIKYSKEQNIEFYDDISNGWIEGTIKTMKNDFYVVSYITKNSFNNSKILYKNNIRPVTKNQDIIKLNIDMIESYSLKNFEGLSNPAKCAKKFIKQLLDLFTEEINFIFLNNNLDLFIFHQDSKNFIERFIIDKLIDIAFKHFKEVEKQ